MAGKLTLLTLHAVCLVMMKSRCPCQTSSSAERCFSACPLIRTDCNLSCRAVSGSEPLIVTTHTESLSSFKGGHGKANDLAVLFPEETVGLEETVAEAEGPLVAVTFQRNIHRKEKYLESEPKALGITQIGLSVFMITNTSVLLSNDMGDLQVDIIFLVSSLLVAIAGSVAIAAQKLHLPTLRACLGMQILACVVSVFNIVYVVAKMDHLPYYCWHYYPHNATDDYSELCHQIENLNSHFFAGAILMEVCLAAISVTLAIYCCKVVNCCGSSPKMPVITVQTPAVQQ